MVRPAQTRIAGTLAATALFALAATEAAAQDGSIVLNEQLQLGDVISGVVLNVENVQEQVTVTNSAVGNSLSGSVENESVAIRSTQSMQGDAIADTTLNLGGDTQGQVHAVTQAGGNYVAAAAYGGNVESDIVQTVGDGEIVAYARVPGGEARLLSGGQVSTSAIANATALGGTGSSVTGSVDQASSASLRSGVLSQARYVPGTAVFSANGAANHISVNSQQASNQVLALRQRSTGDVVEADASANAANAWDMTAAASAAGNQIVSANQGGSIVMGTDQENEAEIRAGAINTAFDFGAVYASADAAGNQVQVGNDDIYLEIDNSQLNSGGVDAEASFSGGNGYDAYVGANAVGNSVTGFVCGDCGGQIVATNTQVNTGSINATATTTFSGSGRSAIVGANAIGNSATFYTSRPGGN